MEKASIDEAYIDLTEAAAELVSTWQTNVLPTTSTDDDDDGSASVCEEQLDADSFVVGSYAVTDTGLGVDAIGLSNDSDDQRANLKAWLQNVVGATQTGSNERLLAAGALLVQRVRREIFNTLGFHCSAGIAHNKTLAKLCAGINKPNRQTILPLDAVQILYKRTPINKM